MTDARDRAAREQPGQWVVVSGEVVAGHGVASGVGGGSPYPAGTVAMQIPHFRRLGLDLARYRPATLNVSIAPRRCRLVRPRYTFHRVAWTDLHPPEDFSFSPCLVGFAGRTYDGLVYHPHPATKTRHFQPPTTVEVIAVPVPGVAVGSTVELHLHPDEVDVV